MNFTQKEHRNLIRMRYVCLLALGFLLPFFTGTLKSQTINWNTSVHPTIAEDVNEGSSEGKDIYFYFEVEGAAISNGKVVITLPYTNETFNLVQFPVERLAGSADLGSNFTISGSGNQILTFNNVNLAQGAAVYYRVPRYVEIQFNGIRPASNVKIDVYKTPSALATGGTKNNIAYNYRYANLQVVDPVSIPAQQVAGLQLNFGANNGVDIPNPTPQTFQFGMKCAGGQVDSLTFTMKYKYGGATLTNWKVNNNLIPANQISSVSMSGSTMLPEVTYTIKLKKTDIPGGKGIKDGDIVPLSVDVVKNNCGGLNVAYTSLWAAQPKLITAYTGTASGAFNANLGDGKQPDMKFFATTWVNTGTQFCQKGSPEMFLLSATNSGNGTARNIRFTAFTGFDGTIDTSLLRVRIGKNGIPAKVKSIIVMSMVSGPTYNPSYYGLPTQISVDLGITLAPNNADTLYIDYPVRWYADMRVMEEGVNFDNLNSLAPHINQCNFSFTDDCVTQNYTYGYQNTYPTGAMANCRLISKDAGISLAQGETKVYSHILEFRPFNAANLTTNDAKAVGTIRLPKSMAISSAADIKVYKDGYPSSPWPLANFTTDNTSNPDSVTYTFELINSTRKAINDIKVNSEFKVDINLTNTCVPAVNTSGNFKISYAFYPTGTSTGAGCADVVYNEVQIFPTYSCQCVAEGLSFTFDLQRTSIIGLKDTDDNQVPDGIGKATIAEGANLKEILVNDTVSLTWNGTVLGSGNKFLYAVLFSELNYTNVSMMNNGIPLALTLNNNSGGVQATPLNSLNAGDILKSYDRGTSVPAPERYAYVWEVSKIDGTAFSDQDKVVLTIPMKATEVNTIIGTSINGSKNITSWMYMTATPLADIPTALNPGAVRKGTEENHASYIYYGPGVASSAITYNFSGPQTVDFYKYASYLFNINFYSFTVSPYEYRHLTTVDSIVIEVPDGYVLPDALSFYQRSYSSAGVFKDSPIKTINASLDGNLPNRKMYVFGRDVFDVDRTNSSKIPLADGFYAIYASNYTITSTYGSPEGTSYGAVTVYTDNHSYTQANVPALQNAYSGSVKLPYAYQAKPVLQYFDSGSLKVGAPSATIKPAITADVTYDLALQNTKTDGDAYSSWLYVQGPVKNARLKVGSDTYIGVGENQKWIQLPVVAMNNTLDCSLTVEYLGSADCSDQKLTLYTLFDRNKTAQNQWSPATVGIAMTDAGFIAAQKDIATLIYIGAPLKLLIQNVDSQVGGSITSLLTTPADPSTPTSGLYNRDNVNVGTSFPVEVVFNTHGSSAMSVQDSITLEIPGGLQFIAGSAYFETGGINNPITNVETLAAFAVLDGTAGTKSVKVSVGSLPGDALSYLRFKLEPTCNIDISKSEQIKATFTGYRPCGSFARGYGLQALSSYLMLSGSVPVYTAEVTVNGSLAQMSCKSTENTQLLQLTFKKTNLPAASVGVSDSVRIVLPKALDINGVINFSYPASGSVSAQSGTLTPNNYIDGENRILSWAQPKAYYDALAAISNAALVTCSYNLNLTFVKSLATSPVPSGQILVGAFAITKAAITCPDIPGIIASTTKSVKIMATPVVEKPANVSVCSNSPVSAITLNGNFTDADYGYRWAVLDADLTKATEIGMVTTSGTSAIIPGFTAVNSSAAAKVVTIKVTPVYGDCDGTETNFTITVNPAPISTITSPTICFGNSVNLSSTVTGMASGSSVKFYTANDGTGELSTSELVVSPLVTTSYYAQVETSAGCLGSFQEIIVTVASLPSFSLTSTTANSCSGVAFDLSSLLDGPATNGVVKYYSDENCTAELPSSSVTSSGTYYLRAENSTCVSLVQSVTLSVKAPTLITTNPVGGSTCAGTHITMTVEATGEGGLTYQWKKDGSDVNNTTSSLATSTPGNYTVDVTGQCGTVTSTTATITAKAETAITTQPIASTTVCEGNSVNLSVYATGEGTLTYQWSDAGGNIPGATNPTLNPSTSGTYYVEITGVCGVATSSNSLVTINPIPVPTISGASSASKGQSGLVYTTEPGMNGYTWNITGGSIISGGNGSNTATVTWGSGVSGTISVTYSSNGCSAVSPASRMVTLSDQSVPAIAGTQTVCPLNSYTYTTESGKFNYTWTVTGGTAQTSTTGFNTVTVLWNGSVTPSVKVSYRHADNSGLPLVDATENITKEQVTTISTAPMGATVCSGGSHYMTVAALCTGTPSYVWKKEGAVVGGNTGSYTATESGSYTVTVTGGCGTATSTPVNVSVEAQSAATLTGESNVVRTQIETYTAGAGSNYTWTVTGGVITSGGGAGDATATILWGNTSSGEVKVKYFLSGCPTAEAVMPIVIAAQETPTLITPVMIVCFNTTQTYTTQTGKFNYLWTVTGGTISSGQGTETITVDWGAAGTGTIKVAYSSASTSTELESSIRNITINNIPTVGTINAPAGVCENTALILTSPTVTSASAITSQGWKLDGMAFTSGSTVNYTQNGQSLVYEAVNACGPQTSNATMITVYALPTVTTTWPSICPGTSIDLVSTVSNPSNYTLSFYTVSTGGTALTSTIVSPGVTTTYYVEARNTNNCTSAVRVPVTITLKEVTAITSQPVAPSVVGIGNSFSMSVSATGANLTYQWYKGGVAINLVDNSTAQSATYSVSAASSADYGNYSVVVSGDCGTSVTSSTVTVNILSADATLKDLKVNGITVPDFNPLITDYIYTVPCDIETASIVGTPNHLNAVVNSWLNQSLAPGDNHYTLTVTAENGFTTKTYTVNVIRDCYIPRIVGDLEDAVICIGETHTFELHAEGQNLTYEWYYGNNRIMGANTNSLTISDAVFGDYERYYVVVRSNYNGFKSSAFSKKVRLWVADYLPTNLKFAEYPNPAITGNTYHIKVDGYIDVTKYTWSYSKEGVHFSPGANQVFGNEAWATFGTLLAGTGTLKVTMEHPCGTRELAQTITVKYPTGTEDVTATMVQVYPNPTSGIVKVSNTEVNKQIRVLDVTGSLKGTYKTQQGTTTIDLTGYVKGTYMLQYNGKTYKIIKN